MKKSEEGVIMKCSMLLISPHNNILVLQDSTKTVFQKKYKESTKTEISFRV